MSKVVAGRMSADIDGDFVVFLIGMRFNRPWHVVKYFFAFSAMPRMVAYLRKHPETGLTNAALRPSGGRRRQCCRNLSTNAERTPVRGCERVS